MKKVVIGVLVAILVVVGCVVVLNVTKKEDTNKTTEEPKTEEKENVAGEDKAVKVALKYEGTDITPGKTFNEKSLSKKASKSTIPSCALEGEDNVYTYDDLEITANVNNGKETIYSVYFITSNVSTNEGIKIGDSKEKMIKAYGTDFTDDVSLCTYIDEDGKKQINFQIEDGIITGIEYIQVLN